MSAYIPTTEAAQRLGVNERHVRRLLENGELAGQKCGRNWIISVRSIASFERHPTKGRPKSNQGNDLKIS